MVGKELTGVNTPGCLLKSLQREELNTHNLPRFAYFIRGALNSYNYIDNTIHAIQNLHVWLALFTQKKGCCFDEVLPAMQMSEQVMTTNC